MELRVVRYFVAVADHGSVSQAAQAVRIAQPSLSRQLRLLERELQAELFTRGRGPLQLSAAGRQFLPIARDLLTQHDRALGAMRTLSRDGPDQITIAAPSTTIADVLAPFLAGHGTGKTAVIAIEEAVDTGYQAVTDGRADAALTISPPPAGLARRDVAEFRLFAYVASSHPWSGRTAVQLEELSGPPLIVTPASSSLNILLPALDQLRLSYQIAYEVPVPHIAQALAAAGHGIAVLSDDPRFGLRPLDIHRPAGLLTVPLYASWDPRHYGSRTIERFVTDLASYCRANWPMPPGGQTTPTTTRPGPG